MYTYNIYMNSSYVNSVNPSIKIGMFTHPFWEVDNYLRKFLANRRSCQFTGIVYLSRFPKGSLVLKRILNDFGIALATKK